MHQKYDKKHERYTKPIKTASAFTIRHYAGEVFFCFMSPHGSAFFLKFSVVFNLSTSGYLFGERIFGEKQGYSAGGSADFDK
jgi:hypothetical protein